MLTCDHMTSTIQSNLKKKKNFKESTLFLHSWEFSAWISLWYSSEVSSAFSPVLYQHTGTWMRLKNVFISLFRKTPTRKKCNRKCLRSSLTPPPTDTDTGDIHSWGLMGFRCLLLSHWVIPHLYLLTDAHPYSHWPHSATVHKSTHSITMRNVF